jgi:hypothetical protein
MDPATIATAAATLNGVVDVGNRLWDFGERIAGASKKKRLMIAEYIWNLSVKIEGLALCLKDGGRFGIVRACAELEAHAKFGGAKFTKVIPQEAVVPLLSALASHSRTLSLSPELLGCDAPKDREEALIDLIKISGRLRALADELQTDGFDRNQFLFWQKVQSTEVGFVQPLQEEEKLSAFSRLFFWSRR